MIRFIYSDDTFCFRALHTVHAVFFNDEGTLVARVKKADETYYEFEIKAFELLEAGKRYP